jgi:hypothetical protein
LEGTALTCEGLLLPKTQSSAGTLLGVIICKTLGPTLSKPPKFISDLYMHEKGVRINMITGVKMYFQNCEMLKTKKLATSIELES